MLSLGESSRGGFALRRGRGGRHQPWVKHREDNKPDVQRHPLGKLLRIINPSDLTQNPLVRSENLILQGCEHVASYSWLAGHPPTIAVPGQPPRWTPLRTNRRLQEDSGTYFRDQNAARSPDYPTAPAVQAVLELNPHLSVGDIDIFACGSTMGNILRFARAQDKAFRLGVEIIGRTVFFIRKENDPKEIIKDVRGFGHTFPEAYTTWPSSVKRSESHQRIAQCSFGGLSCMIRFECDGYLESASSAREGVDVKRSPKSTNNQDLEELLDSLNGVSISSKTDVIPSRDNPIKIEYAGSKIDHSTIFDLKTRSGKWKRDIDMSDILPQLWIKQIPNFIVAYHDGYGLFDDIRVQDVREDVANWAKNNADAIRRFAALLHIIIDIANTGDENKFEIYCPDASRLEIRAYHGQAPDALPADLYEAWMIRNDDYDSEQFFSNTVSSDEEDNGLGYDGIRDGSSDGEELDYTACSAVDCGYCGKCKY